MLLGIDPDTATLPLNALTEASAKYPTPAKSSIELLLEYTISKPVEALAPTYAPPLQ